MGVNAVLERRWRFVLLLAGAAAAVALLSLLLYSAVLGQRGWTAVTGAPREWHSMKALVSAVWENWNRTAPHPLDWLVAAGFIASLVVHRRIARHGVSIALAVFVVLGGVIAFAPIAPFVRSWLFLLPLYLIVAAGGLAWGAKQLGRAAPAVAAIAAIVFAATMLTAGLSRSDVPPSSDNEIIGLLRRYAPATTIVLLDPEVRAPVHHYYYERSGYRAREATRVGSHVSRAGHIVVVVRGGISPTGTLAQAGGVAAGPPRLLIRRRWITFYDVPLARRFLPR
jgi:hypothetical protein